MKIFMTAESFVWRANSSVFHEYHDDIIIVKFHKETPQTGNFFYTIDCTKAHQIIGMGQDFRGTESLEYKLLHSKKNRIDSLLKDGEDVVVLADMDIRSIYILKVLQQIEKELQIHLIYLTQLSFFPKRLKDSYERLLEDSKDICSIWEVDTNDYLEQVDSNTSMIEFFDFLSIEMEETLREVTEMLPRHDGKTVCQQLRNIRKAFARKNNIAYTFPDCNYEGPCAGTCAQCEQELRDLQSECEKLGISSAIDYPKCKVIKAGADVKVENCDELFREEYFDDKIE